MKHISRDWMLTLHEIRYGPSKKKVEPSIQCFIVLNIFFNYVAVLLMLLSQLIQRLTLKKKKLIQRFVSYEPIDEINFLESTLFQWRKT